MRVNPTNLYAPEQAVGHLASYCQGLRGHHTDKMGLSAEAQPPGLTDAQRISLCYSKC
jgi:hypothetical protein